MIAKLLKPFLITIFTLSISVTAVADPTFEPNDNSEAGQTRHSDKCFQVVLKQSANGQTGADTGNDDHDPKTYPGEVLGAVTNCDLFYTLFGYIGPN